MSSKIPNDKMLRELEFERLWRETPSDEQPKLVAKWTYLASIERAELRDMILGLDKRVLALENKPIIDAQKAGAKTGGILGVIAAGLSFGIYALGKLLHWWE